jgi:hypothetical protein
VSTNSRGKRLTAAMLAAAIAHPANAGSIRNFHFYNLRAKAADVTSDLRGDQGQAVC